MRIAIASLITLAFTTILPGQDGKRLAVIVGNDAYPTRPLKNAVNDARLMERTLQAAGFRTILRENAKKTDMEEAMVEMVEKLGPDDTALFFFAGHGVQIDGENFLVPVDFESATTVVRAKSLFFSLPQAIDYIKRSRAKRTILILDACRNNPVAESQALQAGLAIPMNAGPETFVAFSTSPNHVATDNPNGRNSWFTEALGDLIATPGLTIEDVFTSAGRRVMEATKEKQTPWRNSNFTSKFYFHPPLDGVVETDVSVLEKWMDDARRREMTGEWADAIALINQVLSRKPGGYLEEAARTRLPYVMAQRDAQTQFDAAQFAGAAKLYSQAATLDPFATAAAFQGVNSYLLNDQLDEAVAILKTVRVRGTSAAVGKADAMLKELSPIHPPAAEELRAGERQPPALTEVLSGFRFGVPDVEAGKRYLQRHPVDLSRPASELAALYPPPPPPVAPATDAAPPDVLTAAPLMLDLHLEVISSTETRDFKIRRNVSDPVNTPVTVRTSGVRVKVSTEPAGADLSVEGDPTQVCQSPCFLMLAPTRQVVRARMAGYQAVAKEIPAGSTAPDLQIDLQPEYGFVQFDGLTDTVSVLVNGKPASRGASGRLQLPTGKYLVQLVDKGKVLSRGDLEITPLATVAMPVRDVQ